MRLKRFNKLDLEFFFSGFLKGFFCIFFILAIGLFVDFAKSHSYFINDVEAQSLPNCDALASNITPEAGVNCLYNGLPLCSKVDNPIHRVNCADLIDLPLCSQIDTGNNILPKPGRNCVELCSDAAYDNKDPNNLTPIRGVDHAVFNKDCIRFCDQPEDGVVADKDANCVPRKCHQADGLDFKGEKCDMLKCNLLTPDELNDPKFDDEEKKFCDGDNLKCYEFSEQQLPYVRIRGKNTVCNLHNCKPKYKPCEAGENEEECKLITPSCGPDDTLNITNKGQSYIDNYIKFAHANFPLESTAVCKPVPCRNMVTVQYRCTNDKGIITGIDADDVVRNKACDTVGEGKKCSASFCYKTIDCNLESNQKLSECNVNGTDSDEDGAYVDPYDSWFYRPKPLDKSIDKGTGLLLSPMGTSTNELCFTESQMEKQNWGRNIWFFKWWWNHDSLAMEPRSPGACSSPKEGFRSLGYISLCGTDGLMYNKPTDYTAYYKGHTRTTFSHASGKHVITVCVRFKNGMDFNACGRRECGITAGFDKFFSQTCGSDVCKDFEVEDLLSDKCMMTSESANSVYSEECSKTIDSFLRVRLVKYDSRVCAFLDSKGQVAYNKMFLDGTETLDDGETCVNDPEGNGKNGGCKGYDSNSDQGLAHIWRTVLKIPYILNNRPTFSTDLTNKPLRGYIDKKGRFFAEQECPKITLRIPPPDAYNLANESNSPNLFAPPLFIRSASKIKGGSEAVPEAGSTLGKTDFHYPEMKVQFGSTIKKLSLSLNETDGEKVESIDTNSPARDMLEMKVSAKSYQAEIFVKKEYKDFAGQEPVFCLYRKVKDPNGVYLAPIRVGCVERQEPSIDNLFERTIDKSVPVRKAIVKADLGNKFNSSKLIFRYLTSFGANAKDDKCAGDDVCSNELVFENVDYKTSKCSVDLEGYKICAKREECSQIYIDCVENEVALHNAANNNQNVTEFEAMRNYCSKTLIPFCNAKKGITENFADGVYGIISNPNKFAKDENAYGWFNEICVTSGFKNKLRNVVVKNAKNPMNMGKCDIDIAKSIYPIEKCQDGGFAPYCVCREAVEGDLVGAGFSVRQETAREAGLCIDMPLPEICPAVDYNTSPNLSDANDLEYVNQSLGKTFYSNNGGVHISHLYRTQGKPAPDEIKLAGHAEFFAALPGMNDVRGRCNGFFTYDRGSSGVTLYPQMSCLNVDGKPQWDYAVKNSCVRFSCPAITTTGPNESGVYQNDYDPIANGFATWPKFTKSADSDFAQSVFASACIAGYKPVGSEPNKNGNLITGYSGGSMPIRVCNQIGSWQQPSATSYCQKIKCEAFRPTTNPKTQADWDKWFEFGGAVFDGADASISKSRIQGDSIRYGACNNNLGFYQAPNGLNPSRECDYLGNWLPVKNSCVFSCKEILTDADGSSLNNGFAKWEAISGDLKLGSIEGKFISCVSGYVKTPYPAAFDINGKALPEAQANDLTRSPEDPRRLCKTGIDSTGNQVSLWANTINSCINKCPSAQDDPRIGVGRTIHNSSTGSITIDWPSGNFGEYSYVTNWTSEEALFNASYFQKDRNNNGYYLLRRYCNTNGKWSDAEPMCSVNNGQIGNAKYDVVSNLAGYQNSLVAGSNQAVNGSCIPLHWKTSRNKGALPQRSCLFKDTNQNIDETYLELANNTKDCEEIKCQPLSYVGTRALIVAANEYSINQVVDGKCLNDQNDKDGNKVSASLLANSDVPRLICRSNGEWEVLNEANCKKSCSVAPFDIRINASSGNGYRYYVQAVNNMVHGTIISFTFNDGDSSCGYNNSYSYKCNDGTPVIQKNIGYDNGTCSLTKSYNWINNAWLNKSCTATSCANTVLFELMDGTITNGTFSKNVCKSVGQYKINYLSTTGNKEFIICQDD